jgi:hypothetical protein
LTYTITKENKHKSRINISGNYKIMIYSPEVYFGIPRQHAEVGHKNIIIIGYTNHLGRFCRNGKKFLENDLHHNFVQFLVQKLVMPSHTTYPKIGYREFIEFEIWQI